MLHRPPLPPLPPPHLPASLFIMACLGTVATALPVGGLPIMACLGTAAAALPEGLPMLLSAT